MSKLSQTTGPAQIRVLHPDSGAAIDAFFNTAIAGNRILNFGSVDVGKGKLRLAFAETAEGALFPFQYHDGGNELALILAGQGLMEIDGDDQSRQVFPFKSGDLVFVPAGVTYQVRNTGSGTLRAWVIFAEETQCFWPDGSPA